MPGVQAIGDKTVKGIDQAAISGERLAGSIKNLIVGGTIVPEMISGKFSALGRHKLFNLFHPLKQEKRIIPITP